MLKYLFALFLLVLIPFAVLAQTPIDPILPLLGSKVATKIVTFWPLAFYVAHTVKSLWGDRGRKTIVGKVVFPVLDFVTGDTVKP